MRDGDDVGVGAEFAYEVVGDPGPDVFELDPAVGVAPQPGGGGPFGLGGKVDPEHGGFERCIDRGGERGLRAHVRTVSLCHSRTEGSGAEAVSFGVAMCRSWRS